MRTNTLLRRARYAALGALAACAALPGAGALDAPTRAALHAIGERLAAADDAGARAQLDLYLAAHPRGAARAAAEAYQRDLEARELARFEPAFAQLGAALERHDDELARQILRHTFARGPRGAARAKALAFQNIVDGRALSAALELRLEAEPTAKAGEYRVFLVARHAALEPVRVRCPGSTLDFLSVGLAPSGIEQRTRRRVLIDVLDDLELAPGPARRIALGTFEVPVGGLVGARAMWQLDVRAGGLTLGARELPASRIAVQTCEVVRLDPRLPTDAVEPGELVRYVERGAPASAALIERAVRIEAPRRGEALDLLTPVLEARTDDEIQRLAPALSWLAGERATSLDGAAWRRWLRARAEQRERALPPALDLPGAPAPAKEKP